MIDFFILVFTFILIKSLFDDPPPPGEF